MSGRISAGCASRPVVAVVTDRLVRLLFFFFQAEDGIRDYKVTGVQTCALPISAPAAERSNCRQVIRIARVNGILEGGEEAFEATDLLYQSLNIGWSTFHIAEIGRASCRERV